MTIHRHIQIHNLLDTLSSKVRIYRRASQRALTIHNRAAYAYYQDRAARAEQIGILCRARLQAS